MPTYQYRCPSCRHEFEKLEKMTVKTRPKCPECGTRSERLISGGVGLVFKGSGFYTTDYKRAPRGDKTTEGGKSDTSGKPDKSEKAATKKPPSSSSSGAE
jgi:putative FmdB family regulatory protein